MFAGLFKKKERSKGGSQILKYDSVAKDQSFTGLTDVEMKEIEDHVAKYIGEPKLVYHEILSESLHIDVIHVPPSEKVPYNTLVTMGASEFKMPMPKEVSKYCNAEFIIFLPKDWPIGEDRWEDEKYYWPVRLLKMLSRSPKMFNTWFYYGHTIPNGNPAAQYHPSTEQNGALITYPYAVPEIEFFLLKGKEKDITFWCIAPIYESEWQYKLDEGAEQLEKLAEEKGNKFFLIDPTREKIV